MFIKKRKLHIYIIIYIFLTIKHGLQYHAYNVIWIIIKFTLSAFSFKYYMYVFLFISYSLLILGIGKEKKKMLILLLTFFSNVFSKGNLKTQIKSRLELNELYGIRDICFISEYFENSYVECLTKETLDAVVIVEENSKDGCIKWFGTKDVMSEIGNNDILNKTNKRVFYTVSKISLVIRVKYNLTNHEMIMYNIQDVWNGIIGKFHFVLVINIVLIIIFNILLYC